MKIVVFDGYTLNPGDISWQGLEALGDLKIYDRTAYDLRGLDLIIERGKDADAIFTNKTPLNKEAIDKMPNLKYIGVLATGYDVVDVEYAREKGIVVTNVPNYGTTSVAQMVFALLLEICHHVGDHSKAVFQGEWVSNPDWCFWKSPLIELAGKTMGIIGYGRIGQNVAEIAQAFGMKVLVWGGSRAENLKDQKIKSVEFDQLISQSDVISLHCPLVDTTRGIINKQIIAKMKDKAIIINTARGPLIVEEDLRDGLNEGKLGGAGLDVVSSEPIDPNNPLLKAKNCIITPHISWAPVEARTRLMDIVINNFKGFLEGKRINQI